jgi:SAM-dependent methyltransferase
MTERDAVHRKEGDFHDQWADQTPLDQIAVREAFESPAAMENQFILRRIGPLKGIKLLDVGAGLGESAVYFALAGAEVTAADLSPGMVRRAEQLASFHGTAIRTVACPAERLAVADHQFDLVYIANTLHHAADKRAVFAEIQRVLRPGGRFFSIDPLAYNPLINVYRRMATAVRTADERPLTFADVNAARDYFADVGHREFWIASLALFVKFYFVDRVHPNTDRYWKRIYRQRRLWWWLPLREMDRLLTRLPLVRRLAWNMVMWGSKSD